jgi:NAD(P)-dependent dehydrogenase (short-subunit alcohol dehydrogenase family)
VERFSFETAVVTGAASGFGKAISLVLAREGLTIGLVDVDREGLDSTSEEVVKAGGTAEALYCDVTSLPDLQALADRVYGSWGKVDLLINNAGIAGAGDVGDMPMEQWFEVVAVNYWGVVFGCHAFLPRMKARKRGHVLNVASVAGFASPPGYAAYNSTKAAVISLSETLCIELAPYRIGVTVACPTFFKTHNITSMVQNNRYTRLWQRRVCEAAENANPSADVVAQRVFNSVKKNKLYAIPQGRGRSMSLMKRICPAFGLKALARMNQWGKLEEWAIKMASRGWL